MDEIVEVNYRWDHEPHLHFVSNALLDSCDTAVCRFMMDSNSSGQTSYADVENSSNPSRF